MILDAKELLRQYAAGRRDFHDVSLFAADLSNAKLPGIGLWHAKLVAARLDNADLTGANLVGCDLRQANLTHAKLDDAVLTGADLSKADLFHAHLVNADLCDASLCRANLHAATLHRARLVSANLRHADFREADLTDACLNLADFFKANLTRASLVGACFLRTDFTLARLVSADLTATHLDNARFIEADLRDAHLTHVKGPPTLSPAHPSSTPFPSNDSLGRLQSVDARLTGVRALHKALSWVVRWTIFTTFTIGLIGMAYGSRPDIDRPLAFAKAGMATGAILGFALGAVTAIAIAHRWERTPRPNRPRDWTWPDELV